MNRVALAVSVLIFALSFGVLGGDAHAPIVILGDDDFTPENGVISGDGTNSDPYIIAGWEIDASEGVSYGVKIENATASVVLRGLLIRGAGIRLGFVSGATIENCSISNSAVAVEIASSTDVVMRNNSLQALRRGLIISGATREEYRHDIDTTNILNGYPVRYLYGREGETIEEITSSNLYVVNSRQMMITGNDIIKGDGIFLAFVEDSFVTGNTVYQNRENGIHLYRCSGNELTANDFVANNRQSGISLLFSDDNRIAENNLLANDSGLTLVASEGNFIEGNVVFANPTGIRLDAGSTENTLVKNIIPYNFAQYHKSTKYGIFVEKAVSNTIWKNVFIKTEVGIALAAQANDNTVRENTLVAGAYGLHITGSHNQIFGNLIAQQERGILFPERYQNDTPTGNTIRENLLTDNDHHLYLSQDTVGNKIYRNTFLGPASSQVIDYGKNSWALSGQGNFWGDYTGPDADNDGIGDTPVSIVPSEAQDSAPLMAPETARLGLGVLTTMEGKMVSLVNDEKSVQVPVLTADEEHERLVGFRGFPPSLIEDFPGILFVFDTERVRNFTMETVLVPLDIAFFTEDLDFAGGTSMEPGSSTLYTAKSPFCYALELPSGFLASNGIDAGTGLVLPEGE